MTELRKVRTEKHLTQKEAAERIGVSLRSYVTYENDIEKKGSIKYRFLLQELEKIDHIDEEHGILSRDEIVKICNSIFPEFDVDYCYLFGSYAKGNATPASDIDLLVSPEVTGLRFYEMTEKLREQLHKRIDLLDTNQLAGNPELLNEVLKDGIRIYG